MLGMHEDAKEIARILADWAAGQSITVHLFGSRVRGDHGPDSDVDIYIQIERGTEETGDGGRIKTLKTLRR